MKNVEDVYALSPLQESLLCHALSAPRSGVGFEQSAYTIRGELDHEAFEQTWRQIVRRHPILRTAFLSERLDQPVQVVRRNVELEVGHDDWRHLPPAEQRQRLDRYIEADKQRGFDPARAPLTRLALFALANTTHALVWSFHHLLLDGWSRALVLEDVLAAYSALSRGAAPQLAHRPPYRQYVAWLRSQDMTRAERFWRRGLAGFAAPTPLAVDRLALVPPGRGSGSRELYLPADASGRLRAFARQHRLTLNTLVQGAWAILLSRHAARDDVVFGTTVSGRPVELPRVEAIVGMFANNLPVRTRVAPDGAVLTWLRSFQDELAQVRHYEHCSPQQVQAWGGVPWSVRLYDTLVVFQNYPAERSPGTGPAAGLKIEPYHGRLETNLPLTLVAIAQDRLKLRLLYQRRRFDDATAEGLLDQLRDLLDAVTTRPDLPAPELARAGAAAAVEAGDGRPPGIVRILGDLSRSAPDAVAVACGDAALSRAALADRVRRLAGDLEARGLRPGDVAALCPEPGVDQVVALLAVLETGDAAAQAAPLADVCAALARRLDLGTHQVWLAAAPLWETGGVDVLAALLAGTRVELPEPREGLAPVLRRSRSTIVLSTPGQWKDLLAAARRLRRALADPARRRSDRRPRPGRRDPHRGARPASAAGARGGARRGPRQRRCHRHRGPAPTRRRPRAARPRAGDSWRGRPRRSRGPAAAAPGDPRSGRRGRGRRRAGSLPGRGPGTALRSRRGAPRPAPGVARGDPAVDLRRPAGPAADAGRLHRPRGPAAR
jgi:hypothetical protein